MVTKPLGLDLETEAMAMPAPRGRRGASIPVPEIRSPSHRLIANAVCSTQVPVGESRNRHRSLNGPVSWGQATGGPRSIASPQPSGVPQTCGLPCLGLPLAPSASGKGRIITWDLPPPCLIRTPGVPYLDTHHRAPGVSLEKPSSRFLATGCSPPCHPARLKPVINIIFCHSRPPRPNWEPDSAYHSVPS